MLVVQNLRKEFKNVTAVDNISFSIQPGSIFGLLGPNGAGKTTTIRTILDIIKPSSGTISLFGKPINQSVYNTIGYLPEDRGMYKKSKVIDTIEFFAKLKGLSRQDALREADKWLSILQITDYKKKNIEELSKGNQQKIQFVISVLHNPDLLILDEPFSGFDPINQQLMKELVLEFKNAGKIIILSTHQMETAEKLCSEILLINKGRQVLGGSISSIKKNFAKNNIRLEYEGDCSFIERIPYVKHLDNYSNYAEVELEHNCAPELFLGDIISHIKVKHFSVIEPTLNKIFIDAVKQDGKN